MNPLEIINLTKHYGSIQALRGVSFTVQAGEIFGYLGPNGAGKTTTLRIILDLVRATSGDVRLFGESARHAARRLSVGYLPGDLSLDGSMTAQSVLDYFAGYRPNRRPVLRARLLEAFGVDESILSRKLKALSHGTRQKIGLIVAMQHDPDLLLLDEPTSGLDPLVQKSFRELMLDAADRGRAILFSSHVLSEVEAICSRVAILRSGELVAVESIDALRQNVVRRMQVRFRQNVPDDLHSTPGVSRSEISGNEATLWIRGDVNTVLRRIAREDIEHFVFPDPELEDIFLSYYSQTGGSHG